MPRAPSLTLYISVVSHRSVRNEFRENRPKHTMNILSFTLWSLVGSIVVCTTGATALPHTREGRVESGEGTIFISEELEEPRNGITNKQELWPKGEVVYKFSDEWKSNAELLNIFKDSLKKAMDAVSTRTCIKFREAVENDEFYLEIKPNYGTTCEASVGRAGIEKGAKNSLFSVALEKFCYRGKGLLIHELLHAVGLWHEQQRSDRDDYITLLPQNLDGKQDRNYEIRSDASTLGLPYDYKSIMHSVASKGARAGLTAFEPKADKYDATYVGQLDYMTPTDMRKVNTLYEGICE